MAFPSPIAEEESLTINGQQEPVMSFLPERVRPASRDEDSDQYSLAIERLSRYGFVHEDINDCIMQISRSHSIYYNSSFYCRTEMFVGMSKITKEDYDFAECIRAMFRASNVKRVSF